MVNTDKVQGIILDLRDDPGGYVDAAQKIASEFVGDKPLYYEQASTGDPQPQQPIAGGVATSPAIPVVVLVNGGTASALARSSRPRSRATTGVSSSARRRYGKGTIQEFKELPGDGRLPAVRAQVADARPDLDPRRRTGTQRSDHAARQSAAQPGRSPGQGHRGGSEPAGQPNGDLPNPADPTAAVSITVTGSS